MSSYLLNLSSPFLDAAKDKAIPFPFYIGMFQTSLSARKPEAFHK